MRIQTECSEADRAAMWACNGTVWSNLGIAEPYWSVLTDDRWRRNKLNGTAALNAFYASSDDDRLRMDAWLDRNKVVAPAEAVCAEYGGGVGRTTHALARRFRRVIAFDISQPHLEAAQSHLTAQAITNVE